MIPASNTKIFTTAASLDLLGEDHQALTRAISAASIDAQGRLNGDLALHGEHDLTWSGWFYPDSRTPLDDIADQLWARGLRTVSGNLSIWGAWLYDGYHLGTYDPATQRTRVGNAFKAALQARGITVSGTLVYNATMALPAGSELARWESSPLWVVEWPINHQSHNEMADALCRHLGYLEGGTSDYATGGQVVADWLAATGIDDTGFQVHDGSGLDITNRVTARQLVGVYAYMTKSPLGPAWISTLSVGGVPGASASNDAGDIIVTTNSAPYNGTLAYRMTGADTAGRVFGKSGTSAGITTTGLLEHKHDGHRYAFAFLMNSITTAQYDVARAVQDQLVALLAKDHDSLTRPAAPTLGCVRATADGITVDIIAPPGFTPADGQAGFRVETSPDGDSWDPNQSLFTLATTATIAALPDSPTYVRVRSETTSGRSDASDVYAARAGTVRALIVDADDRWQKQPTNENPRAAAHAFAAEHAAALPDSFAFDTCPNERLALASYDVVVWAAGEEGSADESFAQVEQAAVADYLDHGGNLFVSGAEIAYDLDPTGNSAATAADRTFYQAYLRARYDGDDAGTFAVTGASGGIFADFVTYRRISFWTPGAIFVAFPDELVPLGEAKPCLTYDTGAAACVQYKGEYGLVSLGFPFESIDRAADRREVMARVMTYFGL